MFKYSRKINSWSERMIAGLSEIWGKKIPNKEQEFKFSVTPALISYLNGYLKKNGKTIIKRFNKLTGLSYKIDDFGYYVNDTIFSLHNYRDSYISIGTGHSFKSYPTIIIHEISHLYFYKYIESEKFLKINKISKTSDLISEKERNELKEIITVIINDEFSDIINKPDKGYPEHENIRRKISKLWKKNNDFDQWMTKVLKIYKKSNI